MIDLQKITFSYPDGRPLLNELSLHFLPGRFYGVFGPNGCGKSTLFKIISGELSPKNGTVSPRWRDARSRAQQLTLVEQEVPRRIPLTVRETAALGQYAWRRGGADPAAVDAALQRLALTEFAGKPYSRLSGGEKQRVMLGRALVQNTPILLLDEPASSLDPGFRKTFYRILQEEAQSGKCVVMISHDLYTAPQYLDEVLLLAEGALVKQGAPEEVLTPDLLNRVFRTF